jgi:hypothetical protein
MGCADHERNSADRRLSRSDRDARLRSGRRRGLDTHPDITIGGVSRERKGSVQLDA